MDRGGYLYYLASSLVLLLSALLLYKSARRRSRLPFPPGPRPLPIVGNVLDVPTKNLGPAFRDLNLKYGDLVYLNVLGRPVLVIGSYEVAYELLERRSLNTSDKPESVLVEQTGFDWDFALFKHDQRWRVHRRAFHKLFNQNVISQYDPVLLQETHDFLRRLRRDPDAFVDHIRHFFAGGILKIVYGVEIKDKTDRLVTVAQEGLRVFDDIMVPGRYLVEALPFLRHFPSWFPGAGFKRNLPQWRKRVSALRNAAFDEAKANTAKGGPRQSVVSSLLEEISHLDDQAAADEEEVARNVTAVAYITGADTTYSSVLAFFLAMATNPSVQKRAQAELDRVVGRNRLPDFSDRPSLPYINALVKEVTRWHVILPLGLSHCTTEDDTYNGFHIPAGSVLISNAWAYSRDPFAYPDPEAFMPERFLKDGELDPAVRDPNIYCFGHGRRICSGIHFADASLFIIVASVLHVFDVSPPLDDAGRPVHLEAKRGMDMLLSYPDPFECRIKARSAQADALINGEREG